MDFSDANYNVFRGIEDFFQEDSDAVLEKTLESGNIVLEPYYIKSDNLKDAFKHVFLRKNGTKVDQEQLKQIWSSMTLNDYVMSMLNFALTENAWNKTFDASAAMLQTIFENDIAKKLLHILRYIFKQDNAGFITGITLNAKKVKYRFLQLNEFTDFGVDSTYDNYSLIKKQKNLFSSSYFVHLQFNDGEKNVLYPLQTLYKFDDRQEITDDEFQDKQKILVNGFDNVMLQMKFLKFEEHQDDINELFEKLDFVSFLCKDWVCGEEIESDCAFFAQQIYQQLHKRANGMYEDITNGSKYLVYNKSVFTVKYKIPENDEQYVYQKLYGSGTTSGVSSTTTTTTTTTRTSIARNIALYKRQFQIRIESVGLFYDYDTIITMLSALSDVTSDDYTEKTDERMSKSVNTRLEWNIDSEENIIYNFGHISESSGRPSLKSMSGKTSHLWKNGSLLNEFHSYNLPPYHNKKESMNSQYHAYAESTRINKYGLPVEAKKFLVLKKYLSMEQNLIKPLNILDKYLYSNHQENPTWYELDQGLLEEEGINIDELMRRKSIMHKTLNKGEPQYNNLKYGEKYLISIGYTLEEIQNMKEKEYFVYGNDYDDVDETENKKIGKKSKSYCKIYPPHLIEPTLTMTKFLADGAALRNLYCELEKLTGKEKESLLYFFTGFFIRYTKSMGIGDDRTSRLTKVNKKKNNKIQDIRFNYCLYESFLINLKSELAQMEEEFEKHKLKAVGQVILKKATVPIDVNSSSTTTTTTTTTTSTRSIWKRYKIQRTVEGTFRSKIGMFLAKSDDEGRLESFHFKDFGKSFRGLAWSGNLQRFVDKDYWFMYEQYKNLKDYWKNCYEIFEYILRKMLIPMVAVRKYKNRCNKKKEKELIASLQNVKEKDVVTPYYTLAVENLLLSMNYIAEEVLLEDEETSQLIQRRISSRYSLDVGSQRFNRRADLILRDEELLRSRERLQTFIDKFLSIVRSFLTNTTLDIDNVNSEYFERFYALFDYAYFTIGSRVGVSFADLTNLLGNEQFMRIIKPSEEEETDDSSDDSKGGSSSK